MKKIVEQWITEFASPIAINIYLDRLTEIRAAFLIVELMDKLNITNLHISILYY